MTASAHKPVLLQQTLLGLSLTEGDTAIDATAGGGGHSLALAEAIGVKGTLLAIDRDEENLARAKETLAGSLPQMHFALGNFREIDRFASEAGIAAADGILFDLGWSSDHLLSGRGFSLQKSEPLLMTYEAHPDEKTLTAYEIVNTWDEANLADVIYGYGEETGSRRIARAICEARGKKPIETASELAEVIAQAVPRRGKLHPATKTFQALRIAVNDELGSIEEALPKARALLSPEGRLAVISFHSLEDRIIKRTFKEWEEDGHGTIITKRPLTALREEEIENPRARSAKLRIFQKQ
jgi:16S rRNA (cytosine1402-N4)-methyltransferase